MKAVCREKKNILWISFEDTNPFYGCYGDFTASTPNLDRLASEGCLWTNAFSTAGVCAPARSAVITGLYPISSGALHMRTTHTNCLVPELPTPYDTLMPHYVKCFSEYLRAGGYYCTNNYKTDYQFKAPISAWDECSEDAHWRNRLREDQPFFAVFNLNQTHESSMWAEKTPKIDIDIDRIEVPPLYPDTPKVRESLARMYTRIERNDAILGNLLKELEEDGLADNTIVMHWSDHGPLPRGKRWPYDLGIRVPLIVRWPGVLHAGSINKDLVSTVDLAPTVLSILGFDVPSYMQGSIFLGSSADTPRDYIYASRDRYDESYDMVRAIRSKRYKYIRNYCPNLPYYLWIPYRDKHPIMEEIWRMHLEGKLSSDQSVMFEYPRSTEELYDLEKDPYEVNNLAGDLEMEEKKCELSAALDKWMDEVGDYGMMDEVQMVRAWYPEGVQPRTAAPIFIPIGVENAGNALKGGSEIKGPCKVHLHSSTQGASIVYKEKCNFSSDKWQLYTEPIILHSGENEIKAKAIRIGYIESEESVIRYLVN